MVFNEWGEKLLTAFDWSTIIPIEFCEHDAEPSGSIKQELFDQLNKDPLL